MAAFLLGASTHNLCHSKLMVAGSFTMSRTWWTSRDLHPDSTCDKGAY